MPIHIYSRAGDLETRALLCAHNWRLPDQVEALEHWLIEQQTQIPKGDYVADIGFRPREEALGGGGALSPESMRIMSDVGMWLFLSEYPSGEASDTQ